MVFETLGAVNEEGEEVIRQLFTFAAQHLGLESALSAVEGGLVSPAVCSDQLLK